jgi:hypothetical protein
VTRLAADLGSPAGVVVDEPDAAAQPEILIDTLADLGNTFPRPARMLLGFSGPVPERFRGALVAALPGPGGHGRNSGRRGVGAPGRVPADADGRLAAAADLLAELAAAEDEACGKHAYVATRITDLPRAEVAQDAALGVRLAVLRATRTDAGVGWLEELKACERALRNRRARVTEVVAELDRLLARRNELRDSLDIFLQLAAHHGLEEEERLSRYYRAAHDLLWHAPCSLDRAELAVDDYYRAIMRRQEAR